MMDIIVFLAGTTMFLREDPCHHLVPGAGKIGCMHSRDCRYLLPPACSPARALLKGNSDPAGGFPCTRMPSGGGVPGGGHPGLLWGFSGCPPRENHGIVFIGGQDRTTVA